MIKKLAGCIREYKINAILSPVFVAIEVAFDILIPYVMTFLLEQGVEKGNNKAIFLYGSILVVMSLVALIFGALSGIECARASCGFAKNLRNDMYKNIQTFSFSNIDKFSPSSLVTRMTTDVNFTQNSFQMLIRVAVRSPLMLTFALIVTAIMGGWLALIYVIIIPLILFGMFLVFKKVHPIFQRLFKHYDKLNRVVEENVRGMRVVKSNVSEKHEIEKFSECSGTIYKDYIKAESFMALMSPLMQLAMYITITFLAWFGSKRIIITFGLSNNFSVSALTSVFSYSTQVLMSLIMLSMVYITINISRASAERICEVLDEKSDIISPENAIKNIENGKIDFENVCFSYDKTAQKTCLSNINLHINSGETIGIIGGTGSSKTTLIQLIPRLYDATEGEVKVGGINVKNYDLTALRRQISTVLQKNVLFSGTVKDNILWGNPNASDEEIIEALKISQAEDFIMSKANGLDTVVEQGGSNFSGGQRQRLCIARALVGKPKILILDDSTSAVDTSTDRKIRNSFKSYIPETTKIIIAQRITSVMDADRIIVLNGGQIENIGSHDELIKSSNIYKEIYISQQGGGDFDESADN